MATQFTFLASVTVNDMVATDQIRQEIADSNIAPSLLEQPQGVVCAWNSADDPIVIFDFDADLTDVEIQTLNTIVAAHTGTGLMSPDPLPNVTVAQLPTTATPGDTLYVTDGNGPAPAYFDGTNWRFYSDNVIVA